MEEIRRVKLHPCGFSEVPSRGSAFLEEEGQAVLSATQPPSGVAHIQLHGTVLYEHGDRVVLSCGGLLTSLPQRSLPQPAHGDLASLHCLYLYNLHDLQDAMRAT